jgi:hypothetical protein
VPSFQGAGTPNETSFKDVRLARPTVDSNCGVVNLAINRAMIHFDDGPEHEAGRNRLVYGCIMTNAVDVEPRVPDASIGQHPWQRFTRWHKAAVEVHTAENALVANNRLPYSRDSFEMPNYVVRGHRTKKSVTIEKGVIFDYNNRAGISVNGYVIGGVGTRDPKGTPATHPQGFRKGIEIRDNYIYATGRTAIEFTGDGTIASGNIVRMQPGLRRFTHTGRQIASGSATNDNRPMIMRGWRWRVENNDFESYKNIAAYGPYYINDGEGLMHEGHANCTVRDSMLRNNRGNAYLCIYMTNDIDGLLVEGNDIRVERGIAIFVRADRTWDRHPVRNVKVINNITAGGGILISGDPSENNTIRGNVHVGLSPGQIRQTAEIVTIEANENYEVNRVPYRSRSKD